MKQVLFLDGLESALLIKALFKYFNPRNNSLLPDDLKTIRNIICDLDSCDNFVDDVKQLKIEEIIYG